MKKTFTWWTGWVILFPFRLIFVLFAGVFIAASPSHYYGSLDSEHNPDKWKLN